MLMLSDRPDAVRCADPGRRTQVDRQLFARRDSGDPRAREELVARFLPLAQSIARRYEHSGEPLDDLMQVASLALVKAIDRYDPHHGAAFSSFAVPTIAGELKRYFRDRAWAIRPPRDTQELTLRVDRAAERLSTTLNRAPTVAELADAVGESHERVLEAIQARSAYSALSLETPVGAADDRAPLQDVLGGPDDGFEDAETRAFADRLLRVASPRERLILRLRFEQDLTQAEIGAILGVSQMQISRLLRGALERLRQVAEHEARPAQAEAAGLL